MEIELPATPGARAALEEQIRAEMAEALGVDVSQLGNVTLTEA